MLPGTLLANGFTDPTAWLMTVAFFHTSDPTGAVLAIMKPLPMDKPR